MLRDSRIVLGKLIKEGENPVGEILRQAAVSRVRRDTRNPDGSREDHLPSLNIPWWPIVNKYCEGKVKRTPGGEWKRTWNPLFTNSRSIEIYDGVLFVERSGELRYQARLSGQAVKPKGNRVWIGRQVWWSRPETGWPIHEQVEVTVKGNGGPNSHLLKKVEMTCG